MDKYLEEKEIKRIVGTLENPIDKFIVAGIFYGIMGKSREQLTKLKKNDFNLEKKELTTNDGVIKLSDYLTEIIKNAIDQKTYIKMGSGESTNLEYDLNEYSEYIIRTKPNKRNDEGIKNIGEHGLNMRFEAMSRFVGVKLTPSILKQSGAYNCLKSQNKKLTTIEASELLKKNNLGIRNCYIINMVKELNKGYDEKC